MISLAPSAPLLDPKDISGALAVALVALDAQAVADRLQQIAAAQAELKATQTDVNAKLADLAPREAAVAACRVLCEQKATEQVRHAGELARREAAFDNFRIEKTKSLDMREVSVVEREKAVDAKVAALDARAAALRETLGD